MSRNLKLITIEGLILIVVALSVAYATLGQTLNVTGTAQVTGNTWNVKFGTPSCTSSGTGATKNVIVKIEYKSTATAIPTGNVTIGNMGATLVYSQA